MIFQCIFFDLGRKFFYDHFFVEISLAKKNAKFDERYMLQLRRK